MRSINIPCTGISSYQHSSNETSWALWSTFCQELCQDSYLSTCPDPTPLLQVFACCYRTGTPGPPPSTIRKTGPSPPLPSERLFQDRSTICSSKASTTTDHYSCRHTVLPCRHSSVQHHCRYASFRLLFSVTARGICFDGQSGLLPFSFM